MLGRPVADQRQVRPERVGHDVVAVADEDRTVAEARVARDVLDHLGVVVGGEERLGSPPSAMGSQPTKSVSHT